MYTSSNEFYKKGGRLSARFHPNLCGRMVDKMKNIELLQFRDITDTVLKKNSGHLVPLETEADIPFIVRRVYYIYGVDRHTRRGFHSHRKLEQVLICVHGSVKISLKVPYEAERVVLLDSPDVGLYIGPMIWREMFDFSADAVLLVLASDHYDETDYIRSFSDYQQEAWCYYRREGLIQNGEDKVEGVTEGE